MCRLSNNRCGFTLVEMLVVIAILSLVLAGIYGLLSSAYTSYIHTKAKLESQQIARTALDYLVYRLREIDVDKMVCNPNVASCRTANSQPPKAPVFSLKTNALTALAGIPSAYNYVQGNFIQFKADLLPLHGFSESFSDTNNNGQWDWTAGDSSTDLDGNNEYDLGEPELLDDINDNDSYDYFSELWTLELKQSSKGPYYELVETLSFSHLSPDISRYNRSLYLNDNSGNAYFDAALSEKYVEVPVAYGITGLSIKVVPQPGTPTPPACSNPSDPNHNEDCSLFINTHPQWNCAGLSVSVTASNTKSSPLRREFTTLRQFVILRNLAINQ
ncbi:hypothetical protein CSB45_04415 [candidate division KSB3 bacterium]|uniref:Prepilin-type N-terminal cleavage/methylation domain-containing protein n=1 Tax=candidate division KSB3 bacterium TaxID=2044937 RepID=A0A2G6E891_9BACT|nr:MAG: hypothetical protein CSB45_04415 [candidate division KSB3 bacterium]PIE30621.1 MAG: hypothetical protein CSA57_03000 [candidate division KSB3 bacterium]